MRNNNIISLDLSSSREYYGLNNSTDIYKGTSFKYKGKWIEKAHYFNDEYIVDFVSYEGTLYACNKSNCSSQEKRPDINNEYWTPVLSGIEGKVYIPTLDENGNLIFSLKAVPPEDPIDLETLRGEPGKNGESAYEIAKKLNPDIGTEEEWINSLNGLTYKPTKIENGELYFESEDHQIIKVSVEDLKGEKGDPGNDGYTPQFLKEVIVRNVPFGEAAGAELVPIIQDDHVSYQLDLTIPKGQPGEKGDQGERGEQGIQGNDGQDAPIPQFKLVKNDETQSIDLYWSSNNAQSWARLGELGGKSPKLIKVLGNTDNPDQQDSTRRNDRILWGYDGIPVSEWTTLCYLDDLRGDENIWISTEVDPETGVGNKPVMPDGTTEDRDKIWYDPYDESLDSFSTIDFIYQSYLDSGGTLLKDEFIEAFSSINKTTGFEIKFAKSFEDLGEPNIDKVNILWLVPQDSTEQNNKYVEYIVLYNQTTDEYSWEQWGSQEITINLEDYYTKDEVDSLLQDVTSTIWIPL